MSKFLRTELVKKVRTKFKIELEIDVDVSLSKHFYEDNKTTLRAEIKYNNRDNIEEQIDKKISKNLIEKGKIHKEVFNQIGGHSLIGFVNTSCDKYIW